MANERIVLTRAEAIRAYKEARDEADWILVGYMLDNPGENLSGLCKEADPENWDALRKRVQARIESTRSEDGLTRRVSRDHVTEKAALGLKDHQRLAKALDRLDDDELSRAAANVNRAVTERFMASAVGRQAKAAQRRASDDVGRQLGERVALHELQLTVNRFNKAVSDLLPEVREVPESERFWLNGEADRLAAIAEELRYMAQHGKTRTEAGIESVLSEAL